MNLVKLAPKDYQAVISTSRIKPRLTAYLIDGILYHRVGKLYLRDTEEIEESEFSKLKDDYVPLIGNLLLLRGNYIYTYKVKDVKGEMSNYQVGDKLFFTNDSDKIDGLEKLFKVG